MKAHLLKILCIPFLFFLFFSCGDDDTSIDTQGLSLSVFASDYPIAQDSIIACASGSLTQDEYIVYAYPRPGATDIRYFETSSTQVDEDAYTNYQQVDIEEEDFFNGYMIKYTRRSEKENWVIITFFEDGVLNLSQPILLKHNSKNTIFTDEVAIDQSQSRMPLFDWSPNVDTADVIYFQVISDEANDLLSGTYTFDTNFQYYNLDNVVLNVTRDTPPELVPNQTYRFTLMGVSEDNWVNTIIQRQFIIEP